MTDMTNEENRPTRSLFLDSVTLHPELVRRIPQELAFRCHTLPVAESDGAITVAMANPNDSRARDAIAAALGTTPCFVQGDQKTIDALLAKVWSDEVGPQRKFLVCANPSRFEDVNRIAHGLGSLLHAEIEHLELIEESGFLLNTLARKAEEGYDLIILGPQGQSFSKRLFSRTISERILRQLPVSLLVIRRTRWPISRMLILLRGEKSDSSTVDWGIRVARACNATITLLAIVPSVPVMYQGLKRFEVGLYELLSTESVLGQYLRRAAERLVEENLEGTLRLRQGSQEWQSRYELSVGDYDLIIVAADPEDWFHRYIIGGLAYPLLHWTDRPVLIAK
jgi:nucleotide-binding universal stress UspA family protein